MEGQHDQGTRSPLRPHVIVVAGGEKAERTPRAGADYVVAADSGADSAIALGLTPDVVVGDMDSIAPETLAALHDAGVPIERHDVDKDESDLELALDLALARRPRAITVVGGDGGSLGHLLVNAAVVASPRYRDVEIRWITTDADVHVVHATRVRDIDGEPGDVVTLIAMAGDADGVTSTGLRWPLDGRTLAAGSSLGLSNELLGATATVTLTSGTLLAIHERNRT